MRALLLAAALGGPAGAATLAAGPGTPFPLPSAAIAAAAPGDTVRIAPGTYFDCASWRTERVTVDGGGAAVFSDRTCEDKASFIVAGAGTVVRGITFTHGRVPDRNAAGIRMEGGSLLVEDCVFVDEEAAVIAAGPGSSQLVLRRVVADGVGVPGRPLAAVTVGAIGGVRVEDSRFGPGRGAGGALRSEAPATVVGSAFGYGDGDTPVLDAAGPLLVERSTFRLSGARPAAIRASGPDVTVRATTLAGMPALLLQDWTSGTPVLSGNTVPPGGTEASSAGALARHAKDAAHGVIGTLRQVAGRVRRALP